VRSVVVCAYTEERWELLQLAVASAAAQGDDVEVVVVIDHNESLLERSRMAWPNHVVVANRYGRGLSGARNTGIEASEGELIAFLDDDAEAESDWLDVLSKIFDDPTVVPRLAISAEALFPLPQAPATINRLIPSAGRQRRACRRPFTVRS
jgi:glycosyltransferase involved in cell wall biosynthesis